MRKAKSVTHQVTPHVTHSLSTEVTFRSLCQVLGKTTCTCKYEGIWATGNLGFCIANQNSLKQTAVIHVRVSMKAFGPLVTWVFVEQIKIP